MAKKLLAAFSALLLVFSLAACGPGDGGASNDGDTSTTVESGSEESANNELQGEAEEVQNEASSLADQASGEASSGGETTGGGASAGATGGD